jgi:hypothetical protein
MYPAIIAEKDIQLSHVAMGMGSDRSFDARDEISASDGAVELYGLRQFAEQ